MSFNPNASYGYGTAPNYYVDDPEEFLPDYTDSEALSDHQQALQTNPPNVTEIYSRQDMGVVAQRQMLAGQLGYQQNQGQYMAQYYYENPQTQMARCLTPAAYQSYDPRIHQYCPLTTSSLHDTTYNSAAYRSTVHNVNLGTVHPGCPRNYQDIVQRTPAQKQQNVKRYPIKVGTPKYYRKAQSSAVYKRPSALCLPVASQPDPAVHRKHKKSAIDLQYTYPQAIPFTNDTSKDIQVVEKASKQVVNDHKVCSEGDFNLKVSKLESMFAEIEKGNDLPNIKTKAEMAKFAKFLKPRVPSSVKARQEKSNLKSTKPDPNEEKSTETAAAKDDKSEQQDDIAQDSIERLLNQLKKCELAVCSDDLDQLAKKSQGQNTEESTGKSGQKNKKQLSPVRTKSFNYQDITNQMTKSQCEMRTFEPDVDNDRRPTAHEIARRLNVSKSASRSCVAKQPMDDHCALELHRSKSYIVNLIDRALSKELGTVPGYRNYKEFNDMSPRKAIDMMNKHTCGKSEKDLSIEITSALTDSIISTATAPEVPEMSPLASTSSSKGKVCCCNTEEPTYIKQLKQLRWGHLKHIQREVRRLEDLERFLDSCSLNPISEI